MVSIPSWVAGAALSLAVILLGNFIQSAIEERRERRQVRKEWYEETAALARQMKQAYDRRKAVHDRRRAANDNLDEEMNSAVHREILEAIREKMAELDSHLRTDIEVNDDVENAVGQLDEMLILGKREGLQEHVDDIRDQCDQLAELADQEAEEYDSRLL